MPSIYPAQQPIQPFNAADLSNLNPYTLPQVDPQIRFNIEKRRQGELDALSRNLSTGANEINAQFINDNPQQELLRNNLMQGTEMRAANLDRDWLANFETQAKSNRVKQLQDTATRRLSGLQSALRKSKDTVANSAAMRGLKNTGIYDTVNEELNGQYLQQENQISGDLQNSIGSIEDNYTKSLYNINQQAQAKQSLLQDKYQANAQKIAESQGLKSKDKAALLMKLRDQFVSGQRDIQSRYDKLVETELSNAQDNFKNELSLSNVTGTYKGNPTLEAQKLADDKAYKDAMLRLNELKVQIAAQKKKSSGSGSGAETPEVAAQKYQLAKDALKTQGGVIGDYLGTAASTLSSKGVRMLQDLYLNDLAKGAIKVDPAKKTTPTAKPGEEWKQVFTQLSKQRAAELNK